MMEVLLTEAFFMSLSKQLVSSRKKTLFQPIFWIFLAGHNPKTFPAWTIVLGAFIGLIFCFDSVFLVCQSTLYPPEFSYSLLSLCVSVSERKLWCTYGMQCSLLSLCREPERGHTPPNTHKLHTSDALHAAAVSQCFKGSLPLLCSLLASACRCPSGPFCAVCCCCLWFAALCSGPAAIPDLRGFGGVDLAVWCQWCWQALLKVFHVICHFHPTCF